MKRILAVLLTIVLCATLFVACADKKNSTDTEKDKNISVTDKKEVEKDKRPVKSEEPSLAELRNQIFDSEANLGIAYLGYNDGTFTDIKNYLGGLGLYDIYPFVKDIELDRFFVNRAAELYLVVPASRDAVVKVYEGIPNYETFSLDKGEILGQVKDGNPFLMICNESDIMANVILEYDEFEYSPYLSGEDGKLVKTPGIYDFSPYETINKYFGIENNDVVDDYEDYSYLQGTWAIISEKKEMYLELFDGGEAHYEVKSDEEDMNLWGYWSVEGLTLYLDLYGEDYGEAEGKAPLYSGEYGIMYDGEFLTLSLFDGFAMTECMAENGYDSFMCYGVG